MITVLMSVFNERIDFLKESIDSILNQTYSDFEFIVFDDASSSDVSNVLNEYADKDNRIIVVRNKENLGLTRNLYTGVKMAKGSFICRQDSDDVSLPNRFQTELDYMLTHPEVGVAGSRFYSLKNGVIKKVKTNSNFSNSSFVKTNLFFRNIIMHGSVIIRKDVLLNNNLNYDLHFKKSQDYELWSKLCLITNIVVMPDYLCIYRVHSNQISTNAITKKEQQLFYAETLSSNLKLLFECVDDSMAGLQLGLIVCDKKYTIRQINQWCKTLKRQNSFSKVFDERIFNRVVNRLRIRFFLKKAFK